MREVWTSRYTAAMRWPTVIIGAGPAGIMAAIAAARTARGSRSILLIDKEVKPGRKLLATGNGRCNLSNQAAEAASYHCGAPDFVRPALARLPVAETLRFFQEIGLRCRADAAGRIYPASNQAASVHDVLMRELRRLGIDVWTGCTVTHLEKIRIANGPRTSASSERFRVEFAHSSPIWAGQVILCCGGEAAPQLGASTLGYDLAIGLGHTSTRRTPALVPLTLAKSPVFGNCNGIRFEGQANLLRGRERIQTATGEFLITGYGISGIAAMELAAPVAAEPRARWQLQLDLMPGRTEAELLQDLLQVCCRYSSEPAASLLCGQLPNRLATRLVTGLFPQLAPLCLNQLTKENCRQIARRVKSFQIAVTGTRDWDQAQVTRGGLSTDEFAPQTLASRLCAQLFAAGELLDVDGGTGGYNLQWAWSSGWLAGAAAAQGLGAES